MHSVEEPQEIKKYIICKVKIRAVKKKKAKEGGQEPPWGLGGEWWGAGCLGKTLPM